jgi:hypothetical protein
MLDERSSLPYASRRLKNNKRNVITFRVDLNCDGYQKRPSKVDSNQKSKNYQIMLSSKITPSFVVQRFTFVTSSTKCKKDKAWENIKRAARAKEDEKWEKIQKSNVFQGNVGAR